jgi:hypothetical protein
MNVEHDDGIECPKCGAYIRVTQSICPHCGLNLYPTDYNHQELIEGVDSGSLSLSLQAILIGWLAGGFVFFILHLLLRSLIAAQANQEIIISSISVLGGLISGLVTGFIINEKPACHGIFVGCLTVGTDILFDFYWHNVGEEGFINLGSAITWIMIVFCAIVGSIFAYHSPFSTKTYEFPEDEYSIYRDLLSRVQNDPNVVERLVEFERTKIPHADRIVLMKNALQRWKRDNRL